MISIEQEKQIKNQTKNLETRINKEYKGGTSSESGHDINIHNIIPFRQHEQWLLANLNITQQQLRQQINYLIGCIRDPQRQQNLLQLKVIQQQSVHIQYLMKCSNGQGFKHSKSMQEKTQGIYGLLITIVIKPTVPHCHLTHQIGLAIRMKLMVQLPDLWNRKMKIIIKCKEGSHNNSIQVQKQINDKERIAAALENQQIFKFISSLINN